MRTFGIIGYPLSHSYSPKYFTEKFSSDNITDCEYKAYPILKISMLSSLLNENPSIRGLNVTIPYKIAILPFIDVLDESAHSAGAVNTIKVIPKGVNGNFKTSTAPLRSFFYGRKSFVLMGFNTDIHGFEYLVKPYLNGKHEKALILGTGGAARAAAAVLRKYRFDILNVTRKITLFKKRQFNNIIDYPRLTAKIIKERTFIINATPLGMYPETDKSPPVLYDALTNRHILIDMVYNPEETLFMKKGRERSATAENGMKMLQIQAEKSWEIWNNDN